MAEVRKLNEEKGDSLEAYRDFMAGKLSYIDYVIDRIPSKVSSWIAGLGTAFLVIDLLFTAFGLKVFYTRLARDYNIELKNNSSLVMDYNVLENEPIKFLSNNIF